MVETPNATRCFVCGHANQQVLEEHHLVPQRLNGGDTPENTVYLCGSCHNAIETLYDDDFYRRLGVAVDGVDDDAFANRSLGAEVSPQYSHDREIPKNSTHVNFESWALKVKVEDVRNPEEMETDLSPEPHERVVEKLKEEKEGILRQYAHELENAKPPTHYRDSEPEWWVGGEPPVDFLYRHGDATVPVFRVINPSENGIDYELWEESDDEDGLHYRDHPRTEIQVNSNSAGLSWRQAVAYRMHCGYCHSVFSEFEHSDLARHLRLRHGVEDPWTAPDQTFSNESGKLPLRDRRM